MAVKGEWVQVHSVILTPEQRAPQVPDDTKLVPLEMWVKGTLLEDAEIGDRVRIKTVTGRIEEGTLVVVRPNFSHSFGNFIPEMIEIHEQLTEELAGGDMVAEG